MQIAAVTLTGEHARLETTVPDHAAGLWRATADTDIWTWMPTRIDDEAAMRAHVEHVHGLLEQGAALPFTIFTADGDEPIGASGYWAIDAQHRRLEIGLTWLNARWQRTAINTECKLLLLRHAFESLGCLRVEFKTDARNTPSRTALRRIGAVEEGTLRRHMLLADGRPRDSVYYSILAEEWPAVRSRLESLLRR